MVRWQAGARNPGVEIAMGTFHSQNLSPHPPHGHQSKKNPVVLIQFSGYLFPVHWDI